MLLPLFEQFSDASTEELRARFKALTVKDIKVKCEAVRPNQMKFTATVKDKELRDIYTALMDEEYYNFRSILDVEKDNLNRLHLSGIPTVLRGTGLGVKIYAALLKHIGMISTTKGNASPEVNRVWDSLIRSQRFAYFHDPAEHIRVLVLKKYAAHYTPIIEKWFAAKGRELVAE